MTLFYMDSFDHYDGTVANLSTVSGLSSSNNALVTTRVRTGTYSLRGTSSSNGYLVIGLPDVRAKLGFGFGYWQDSASSGQKLICAFTNNTGSTAGIDFNIYVSVLASGAIEVRRQYGSGTLLGTSATSVISYGAWNHIEIMAVASNTVGQVQIRVNGIEVLNLTGLDTVYTGTEYFGSIYLDTSAITSTNGNGNTRFYDDLFAWDGLGSLNNDFIGDRKVVTLNPTDNTSAAEWTVSGAATAVQAINDTNNGDTSYISASDSVPVTSDFEIANPDASVGAIAGVMTVVCAKKVDAGTAILSPQMVVSSSATSDATHSISDSYAYYNRVHETNPSSGTPWSASALTSARLRLRRTT